MVATPLDGELAALAYTLMQRLRALALVGTELERVAASTIRVRPLKIGAAILRNTRRIRLMLAAHHPMRGVRRRCPPSGWLKPVASAECSPQHVEKQRA